MKKLLLFAIALLPMSHVGAVVIDGINYHLIAKGNVAEVSYTSNLSISDVVIPQTIVYDNIEYTVIAVQESAFSSKTNLKSITLPKVMTSIGRYAFYNCSSLKSIVMPDTLKELGEYAFGQCSSLRSVKIPQGVSNVEKETFWQCKKLLEIYFPNSIKRIKERAFQDCNSLNAVYISDLKAWCNIIIDYGTINPLQYAKRLFINNTEIKDLVIPNDVTSINGYVFSGCENLESVTIPDSFSSFGEGAFNGCNGLKAVYISDLASWCQISFGGNMQGNISNPLSYAHHLFVNGDEIKDLVIPNSVMGIRDYAFYGCTGLTSVTIPNQVTSIGNGAFYGCNNLLSVNIPNGVTTIGECAFYGCNLAKSFQIGKSVVYIYNMAFANCQGLTDVYCHAINVPITYSDVFKGSYIDYATLHVPAESVNAYKEKEPWKNFKSIVIIEGGDTPEPQKCNKPTISYKNGQLIFTSSTDGAEFVSEITDSDIKKNYEAIVTLKATYYISVYATKTGYDNSETATAILCWIDKEPTTEGVTDGVAQISSKAVLIQSESGILKVEGVDEGTHVSVFTADGKQAGSAVSRNGTAFVGTNIPPGNTAIVKIGEKPVKIVVK